MTSRSSGQPRKVFVALCILYWRLKVKRPKHQQPCLLIFEPIYSNLSFLYSRTYSRFLFPIHPVRFFDNVPLFCLARVYRMRAHTCGSCVRLLKSLPKFPVLIVFYYVLLICACVLCTYIRTHTWVLCCLQTLWFTFSPQHRIVHKCEQCARNISKEASSFILG